MIRLFYRARLGLLAGLLAVSAVAQDVRVSKSGADKTTIDWSGFGAEGAEAALFLKTVQNDLERSGWFELAAPGRAELRVTGNGAVRKGEISVQCRVVAAAGSVLLSRTWRAPEGQARRLAHLVADALTEAIGQKGFASARLVLVGNRTGKKELYVCDSDGANLQQLTQDKGLNLYPRWSPDGKRIIYTGYLRGFPDLYQVELESGRRQTLSNFPGLNAGGALSPDGRYMALILSRDGNPELYVRDTRSGALTRMTKTLRAIESSPSWSPDGRTLVFVSDLSGTPQLYLAARDGGPMRRMTGRGAENVAPHWGANGLITFASRMGRAYQIGILNPETGETRMLSLSGSSYEDPSWAPNGRHLAATRVEGGRSSISLIDTMTGKELPLLSISGDWFSASWSW
ncbi:MAG: hypothetical protein U1E27_04935 [Kiritimatiellia bacterium]|nr:hypothetical protein [Kiritimatiellia bacterium]